MKGAHLSTANGDIRLSTNDHLLRAPVHEACELAHAGDRSCKGKESDINKLSIRFPNSPRLPIALSPPAQILCQLTVVPSRHPGRYPKLEDFTLPHPALEPLWASTVVFKSPRLETEQIPLSSGSSTQREQLSQVESSSVRMVLLEKKKWMVSAAVSSDGQFVAAVEYDGMFSIWDMNLGEKRHESKAAARQKSTILCITADDTAVVTRDRAGAQFLRAWDLRTGRFLH